MIEEIDIDDARLDDIVDPDQREQLDGRNRTSGWSECGF